MASYAAQLEQYQKAIDIYEQVSTVGLRALRSAPRLCTSAPSLSPCPSPPPFLSTSLCQPLALTLYLAWLHAFSTHDPMQCHYPLPS